MSLSITDPAPASTAHAGPAPARWPFLLVAGWLLAALAVSQSGLLEAPPLPLIPAMIFSPVVVYLLLRRQASFTRGLDSLPLWPLVAYHLIRAPYGLYFLLAHARGELPASFALTAGYGDIVSGLLAVPAIWAALSPAPAEGNPRRMLLVWSAIALGDMLLVIATAQRLVLLQGDTQLLRAFAQLPYSVLPVFVVPMVLISHLEVLRRLRRPPVSP